MAKNWERAKKSGGRRGKKKGGEKRGGMEGSEKPIVLSKEIKTKQTPPVGKSVKE